jgi:hypothetical protein
MDFLLQYRDMMVGEGSSLPVDRIISVPVLVVVALVVLVEILLDQVPGLLELVLQSPIFLLHMEQQVLTPVDILQVEGGQELLVAILLVVLVAVEMVEVLIMAPVTLVEVVEVSVMEVPLMVEMVDLESL